MGKHSVLDPALRRRGRPELSVGLRRYRRARLDQPLFEWGGVFENWSRNFVKRNFWRVSATFMSEEDALQECATIFLKCRNKYAGKLDGARHLMSLYQTALTRSWHTFAAHDPHFRCVFMEDDPTKYETETPSYSAGPLLTLLAQCDSELKAVIDAIIGAPTEFLTIIFRDDDTAKITNRVARMFGIKAGERDLIAELRALLLEGITA